MRRATWDDRGPTGIGPSELERRPAPATENRPLLPQVLVGTREFFCHYGPEGRVVAASPEAAAWLGRPLADVIGARIRDIVPRDRDGGVDDLLGMVRRTGEPMVLERVSRVRPGRWVETKLHPLDTGVAVFYRDITRRKATQVEEKHARALLQAVIDAMPCQVAVLNAGGDVIAANLAWLASGRRGGVPYLGCPSGSNYLAACWQAGLSCPDDMRLADGLAGVLGGVIPDFCADCSMSTGDGVSRCFRVRATRCRSNGIPYVVVIREDVTQARSSEEALRRLAGQLLTAQDAAKREIARELHDTTAQELLCASLELERASRLIPGACREATAALARATALISSAQGEIRTLAYRLHPPMLDEAGLATALRWYACGFGQRTGLAITLEVDPELETRDLPPEVGTALFRVAQEALTNVHRHSGSKTARITLAPATRLGPGGHLKLEIADDGNGSSPLNGPGGVGIGLMGMRERLRP